MLKALSWLIVIDHIQNLNKVHKENVKVIFLNVMNV